MGFGKRDTSADALKEGGNSKYINTSGIYPATILATFVSQGNGGSISTDFFIDVDGQEQVLYGNLRVVNNNGDNNEIGLKLFNKLLIIADVDEDDEPEDGELPIGPKGVMKDVPIIGNLCDIPCHISVQMEYSKYNGSFTEKKVIRNFYTEDGLTAEEKVNGSKATKMAKDQEYAVNNSYKESKKGANDAPTPEEITAWIAAKRPKGTANGSTGGSKAPKASFGKKKFGQK